jgi:hypothetical protein
LSAESEGTYGLQRVQPTVQSVRARLIAGETTDLEGAQTQLRQVAADLTGNDREVAVKLIDRLPAAVAAAQEPPPEPSPEMLEALQIIEEGKFHEAPERGAWPATAPAVPAPAGPSVTRPTPTRPQTPDTGRG